MKTKKKDKHYIPILDQPIEILKKPIGDKVDFNAMMKQVLSYDVKKKGGKKKSKVFCLESKISSLSTWSLDFHIIHCDNPVSQ